MKLSARNQLPGIVEAVTRGATTTHIRLKLPGGQVVTAAITNEAAEELGLAPGKPATAIVKASDVMIGVAD